MSVTTGATVRSEENLKVTRSRRNVAWTGLGALVVVVVLALFPYIVSTTTTTSAPTPVQATFLRDRVTRYFSAERAVVSVTTLILCSPARLQTKARSCRRPPCDQALGPEYQHGKEDDVPGEEPVG